MPFSIAALLLIFFKKEKNKLLIATYLLDVFCTDWHQFKQKWNEKFTNNVNLLSLYLSLFFSYLARKSEIIRSTELLLEAISCNDFESYAYVEF